MSLSGCVHPPYYIIHRNFSRSKYVKTSQLITPTDPSKKPSVSVSQVGLKNFKYRLNVYEVDYIRSHVGPENQYVSRSLNYRHRQTFSNQIRRSSILLPATFNYTKPVRTNYPSTGNKITQKINANENLQLILINLRRAHTILFNFLK